MAYDQICSLTTEESDLNIKNVGMLLQVAMFINIDIEYTRIVSIIELE